ncbi:ISWI chromatin-remodeling complex ATPase ISW2 [Verticillium alfalfae VaMs.102]|uniref:ISWI chromatin-remodeling complex ATPase ISW2 n=1 Tax=Verticillium alfalfae (strain VaMs.102 / ATCC MYA-4576 / FGSC 10136) TaxID=526221 RepID=C9S6T2_VERA1|nr:ISWI chromatin-remodeling complex ATPase ISW2 [Verticillium alfalfae VaMs.102]EEY15185.1 ISWI chromatin-remodeling complex ATPase ISW2 [Verticillium alfalfae VaMs.102]
MASPSPSDEDSVLSQGPEPPTSESSPPPEDSIEDLSPEAQKWQQDEEKARTANEQAEKKRRDAIQKRKDNKKPETKAEREQKARQLDDLLLKSAAFSDILTKKTQVLGKVGSGLDGKTLGEHDLHMAKQPKSLINGKTVQVISLIALLREEEFLGPHLVIAPLSTLSNWINEFKRWCPSIPVVLYHGTPKARQEIWAKSVKKHLKGGRPTESFPVVCTSYEMVLVDKAALSKVNWGFIIIDEGHRMKNFDSMLSRELRTFTSATRLLITGTPLQNNLRELWSLLHFLLPTIFSNWDAFESWFDFSDLQDVKGTSEFIADRENQELIKKIHLILQPLLLRRVKADVAKHLPKKREYILYAPMTKEQTDLYNAISDKNIDSRTFLENRVIEALEAKQNEKGGAKKGGRKPRGLSAIKNDPPQGKSTTSDASPAPNAFTMLMTKKIAHIPAKQTRGRSTKSKASTKPPTRDGSTASSKRKTPPTAEVSVSKSAKSSRASTPAVASKSLTRQGRSLRRTRYTEADSDEDKLSDDEFEAKLADEIADDDVKESSPELTPEEADFKRMVDAAKLEISRKKLGNPLMQLRLVANSPHNFFNPWGLENGPEIDESIVTASGKMLLLDRLLPALLKRGHKVLIFSQFKTQLDILHDYCTFRKLKICRIDGSVSQAERQEHIDAFNSDSDFKVFLLSTRAGGQGINLTAADTVILFDSDWNPQQDLQAQDRVHRLGQTKPVVIFRLATKGTVEDSLLLSVEAKRRLEKLVIKGGQFRTMGQKINKDEDLDEEKLKALLLKDGHVYEQSGSAEILSDKDVEILCDRSDSAYERAAIGDGNADSFKVVETAATGILAS